MVSVILSGGSGSRLWPVSRDSYPKQFCELMDQSFLLSTLKRVQKLGEIQVVTLESMKSLTQNVLGQVGASSENLILEPLPKNTAPAIALVVWRALRRKQGQEVIGIFPADHLISDEKRFCQVAKACADIAAQKSVVVTIGIAPLYPATGYGYIELAAQSVVGEVDRKNDGVTAYGVHKFHEKPNIETAQDYYAQSCRRPSFFWNAGIFFFRADTMAKLFAEHMPEMWAKISGLKDDLSNLSTIYSNISGQSLDYGVIEKLKTELICVPADMGWSDVGSWDEIARLQEEKINFSSAAEVFCEDAENNFVFSTFNKVVGLVGVKDLIVVDTPDALLVTRRGQSQKIKDLVLNIKEAKIPAASEHIFEVRPWGRFEVLADESDHKVKRLIVNPKSQLSYQRHTRRDENWVIVSGQAEVVLEDKVTVLRPGQQIYIPKNHKHRIRNPGNQPLVMIEVQTGEYFGEDDIERFADDYQRK